MNEQGDQKGSHFKALLDQRAESADKTRLKLVGALARFEKDQLIHLPANSKLTVRNLAAEASVSKDTPLSRFRQGHPRAGEYRFPDVVERFNSLRAKPKKRPPPEKSKDEQIGELKEQVLLLARNVNKLDAENYEKDRRIRELEEEIKRLRQK